MFNTGENATRGLIGSRPNLLGTLGSGGVFLAAVQAQRLTVLKLPVFQAGGLWASPKIILTWGDFWRLTGPKTFGTAFAFVGSCLVAGATRPLLDSLAPP